MCSIHVRLLAYMDPLWAQVHGTEVLYSFSVAMSYIAVRAEGAFRICSEVLLAREEFAGEFTFLQRIKADHAASNKIDTFFNRTLDVQHYRLRS